MKKAVLIAALAWSVPVCAYSWDDISSHPNLTSKAFESSFVNYTFRQNYLLDLRLNGFSLTPEGQDLVEEEYVRLGRLASYPIWRNVQYKADYLVQAGAQAEDYPNLPFKMSFPYTKDDFYYRQGSRASHHFHDPLNPVHPGLDNSDAWITPIVREVTDYLSSLEGVSAANRALGWTPSYFGDEGVGVAMPWNYFDWKHAREYFHKGLTEPFAENRSHYLALTFIALGHVMHLVEDVAVPAHVRNDMAGDHIYSYVTQQGINNVEDYVKYRKTGFITQMDATSLPRVSLADIPSFWDGGGDSWLGLSEFTQDNFLSLGTVFATYYSPGFDNGSFSVDPVDEETVRVYFGNRMLGAESFRHLARVTLKAAMLAEIRSLRLEDVKGEMGLDEACYEDYANVLLPRAVSYASGVLRHFFRGYLDVGVGLDGSLRVVNGIEEPLSGEFRLYGDTAAGSRDELARWTAEVPAHGAFTAEQVFPVSGWIDSHRPLLLVFRGQMGAEPDAVVGKAFYVPNEIRRWVVRHYDGAATLKYSERHNGEHMECWDHTHAVDFGFSGGGGRTVHELLFLTYNPESSEVLPLGERLTARAALVPFNVGCANYSFPGPKGDTSLAIFGWRGNDCGDPAVLKMFTFYCGLMYGEPEGWWGCGPPMDLVIPEPVWEEAEIRTLTPLEAGALVSGMHRRLGVPPGYDLANTSYAVVSVEVPAPGAWELTDDHLYEYYLPFQPEGYFDLFAPEAWDIGEIRIRREDGTALPYRDGEWDCVYGPGYDYLLEDTGDGYQRQTRWSYNPDDPFTPLVTVLP